MSSAPAEHGTGGWRSARSVADGAFAVAVAVTTVCYVVISNGYGFAADDWRLAQRGGSIGDYFEPYNKHLSIVPIAVYKFLYEAFGLRTHLPLGLVGVLSGAAVGVAVYLVVRSRVGPVLALVAGVSMLWYPRFLLIPAAFNHYLALAAVFLCAWLLTIKSPKADIALALALGFALCSSGVGSAGAVGCLAYVALLARTEAALAGGGITDGGLARLVGVRGCRLGHRGRGSERLPELRLRRRRGHRLVRRSGRGQPRARHRARRGVRGEPGVATPTAARRMRPAGLERRARLLVGRTLAFARRLREHRRLPLPARRLRVRDPRALLPDRPPRRVLRGADGAAAVGVGLALSAVLIFANQGAIFDGARNREVTYGFIRQHFIVANLGPTVVPDRVNLPVGGFTPLEAGVYRRLTEELGTPPGTRPTHPDAALIDAGDIRPIRVPPRPGARCVPVGRPLSVVQQPIAKTLLRSTGQEVVVHVRRFERVWITIGRILPGPRPGSTCPA